MKIYENAENPSLIHCLTILHARTMTATVQTPDERALPPRNLLFFFVLSLLIILFVTTLGLLSLDAPRTSTSKGRSESKVNVLLGVETNDKRRDIDNLFSNATRKRGLTSFTYLGSRYIKILLKSIPDMSLPD